MAVEVAVVSTMKSRMPQVIITEIGTLLRQIVRKTNGSAFIAIIAFTAGFIVASIIQPPGTPTTEQRIGSNATVDVTRVIDGDTIIVTMYDREERVRLLGIDTPESSGPDGPECFARESTRQLTTLLQDKTVRLQDDPSQQNRDRYDRLLRYVYLPDGQHVNQLLIESGYAYEYTYAGSYLYQDAFIASESRARQAQIGLWSQQSCSRQQ